MRLRGLIGGLLLSLGALRIGYAQVLRPVRAAGAPGRIDRRYAGLDALLVQVPIDRPLAYRAPGTPDALSASRRFGQASYALAPRVLSPDDGSAGWVLLDLERAGDGAQALRGVQILGRSKSGLVLLGHRDAKVPMESGAKEQGASDESDGARRGSAP